MHRWGMGVRRSIQTLTIAAEIALPNACVITMYKTDLHNLNSAGLKSVLFTQIRPTFGATGYANTINCDTNAIISINNRSIAN